jgi:transcriptional regulator with XRE-family HTH domain
MSLGRTVNRMRAARGMKQADLAKRARLSQGYVSKLEVGAQRNPSVAVIRRLAKALGVPVTKLLE